MVSESELSVVISHDALTERVPGTLPGHRVLLGDLSVCSEWLRNSGSVYLQGLCKLIKHLLVFLISHVTVDQHVSVWLQVRSVVT